MSINLILKLLILEKFGSQANFAQTVGADEGLVSRIVHGRRFLPEEKKMQWAKALGIDPDIFPSAHRGVKSEPTTAVMARGEGGIYLHAHSANVQTEKKTS